MSGARTVAVDPDDPTAGPAVEEAAGALGSGRVVAVPTDTVYGLAARMDVGGVDALFRMKGRPRDVAIPVLVADLDQARRVGRIEGAADVLAEAWWPGPLTLVVARAEGFDVDLGGADGRSGTVGLRCPDAPLVRELCRRVGPLAVTSANRHGEAPIRTAEGIAETLAGEPDLAVVVDGGACGGEPSTVVDVSGPRPVVLREGAVPPGELAGSLGVPIDQVEVGVVAAGTSGSGGAAGNSTPSQ